MDFSDLITELGALPGQLPDVEEREPRFSRFVRSAAFDNPQMLALYHAQGLPVEDVSAEDTYIVEPEDVVGGDKIADGLRTGAAGQHATGDAAGGAPVLFEAGACIAPGGLETVVTGDRVRVDLCATDGTAPDATLVLELVLLRSSGLHCRRYVLPSSSGRVLFLAPIDGFAVRATLFSQTRDLCRPLIFGPRVPISRAK